MLQWSSIRAFVKTVSDDQTLDTPGKLTGELLLPIAMNVYAVRREAVLPAGLKLRANGCINGYVEICIREHDERRMTAKCHAHTLYGGRSLAENRSTHFGGAGERDDPDSRFLAEARHNRT